AAAAGGGRRFAASTPRRARPPGLGGRRRTRRGSERERAPGSPPGSSAGVYNGPVTRRRLALALALLLVLPAAARAGLVPPGAAELRGHVSTLASPDLEGRGSGTPGGEQAGRYIAAALAAPGPPPRRGRGPLFPSFSYR